MSFGISSSVISHREPRGNLRNRESCCFTRKRRAPRNARIHFDDHHASGFRIHCKLNIRSARFHPTSRITAADASRIRWYSLSVSVCAGATVIESPVCTPMGSSFRSCRSPRSCRENRASLRVHIPSSPARILRPALHARGSRRALRDGIGKFFAVVGDRAARAAKRKGRPNDNGISELVGELQRVLRIVHQRRGGDIESHFAAGVFEPQAIFGHFYGAQRCADQFDPVFIEDSALG